LNKAEPPGGTPWLKICVVENMEQEHHSTLATSASSAETADRSHQSYAYDAFISYRRRDATRLARWIRNKLLQFHLPPEIVQELPRHTQELHDRRPQIWLDTSYEKSSDDFLLKKVFPALDTSARLIVVNTPAALENITANDGTLQDNWLVREIDHFLREARAGESERPVDVVFGPGSMEGHYPGRLSEKRRWDWIDLRSFSIWRARTFSDTLDDGFTKLVAALYDVPDQFIPILRREERRRQRRVIIGFAIAGLSVAAITTAIAIFAFIQRGHAISSVRDMYLAQAQTLRQTLDPERRVNSLKFLAQAAELRVGNDLRDEAAAAMALVQLQNRKVWNGWPLGTNGIGFNSNLERYARGDDQGNISIRQIEDDTEMMHLPIPGFGSHPWVLRFSPDDRYLAAKYDSDQLEGQLYVWDLSRPGTKAKYFGTTCNTAFDFDPSSQVLAVGRCDGSGSIDMFDLGLASGMPTKSLKQVAEPQFIAFRPDGRALAVSSHDQPAVQVLELNQDKPGLSVSIPTGAIGIAWNADGRLLAVAGNDRRIYVWDVANLREGSNPPPLSVLTGHEAEVRQVAFSTSNNLLASTANDETVRIWEPIRGKQLIQVAAGTSPMQFSADGRRLAFVAGTRQLVRWELAAPSEYKALRSYEAPKGPWSADFSPDGRLLASAHGDGLRIWDLSKTKEIALIEETEDGDRLGYIRSVLFAPDGTKLITCGPGDARVPGRGGLYIWSIESQAKGIANALPVQKSRKIDLPKDAVCEWAALGDKGRTLVLADGRNGQVMLRDLNHSTEWTLLPAEPRPAEPRPAEPRRAEPRPAEPRIEFVAIHPDARCIAFGKWQQGIWALDLGTNNSIKFPIKLESGQSGPASFRAVFSPNGRWLVTGSPDQYHVWEVGSWAKPVHELAGYHGVAGLVGASAFSPDGTMLAIARSLSEVELVDANKGWEKIVKLTSPDPTIIESLKFSTDGSQLAVITQAHLIYIWDLRAIRQQLATMDLDWALPPYPASQALLAPRRP
jgi:WD40 repeat protein